MEKSEKIYEVHEVFFAKLKTKLDKLNRKALKLSCLPIILTIIGEVFRMFTTEDGRKIPYKAIRFTLSGVSPKLNDWTFIAKLCHEAEGNVIKKLVEDIDLSAYRFVKPYCEHCKTDRLRLNTYLLQHNITGEIKQVGSDCLKDFTGHVSPDALANYYDAMLSILGDCDDYSDDDLKEFAGHGFYNYVDLFSFLNIVAMLVRLYGFISKSMQRNSPNTVSTCDTAMHYYNEPKDLIKDGLTITDADKDLAKKAVEWIRSIESPDNDYMHNLSIVCKHDAVKVGHEGIACSLISAYNRAMEKLNPKPEKPVTVSEYQGNVGERLTVTVKINKHMSFDGHFGVSHLYIMSDDNGNTFKWSASQGMGFYDSAKVWNDIFENDTVKLIGTVKKHDLYKGLKQTVLTRCKVLDLINHHDPSDAF